MMGEGVGSIFAGVYVKSGVKRWVWVLMGERVFKIDVCVNECNR